MPIIRPKRNVFDASATTLKPSRSHSAATEPVAAVAVTMPPWPGEEEAVFVQGVWG